MGVFGVLRVELVVDEFVYFGDGDCACGGKLLRGDADALCELLIGGLGVCDFEEGVRPAPRVNPGMGFPARRSSLTRFSTLSARRFARRDMR